MDIKSASKAHTAEHKLEERTLTTEYYEPAAIPSAAAPQTPERASTTAVAYTPNATNPRFPNSHGSSEEHTGFSDRFYERSGGRVADPEYLRRPGYHDTSRGRARDRLYRNGPYPAAIIDRSHRSTLGSSWPYEGSSARYTAQPADSAYVTSTPVPESAERRSSSEAQITKKKTKSHSGSRTPSPSGSTSSRSPSRSRSRSSSSTSSSSTSRGSSSPTSSPRTRGSRVQSAVNAAPPVHSEDRRPLAIIVRNLPARSSDTSLKDGLFHEYKKHGKVTWVKVVGQSADRYALVCFKKPDDVDKALEVSYDKSFFGCKIEVGPYQGYDVEDNEFRPYEAELDEYHPKATRTLFIGNLEKDVTASELRKHFDQFGEIIEIDIKKQGAVSSYAFCQYSDIVSVVKAIRKMDGEHLGNNRIKLGFGKSMPTPCVWVDGVSERVDEKYLTLQFERYGQVTQISVDRDRGHALIFFEQLSCAQTAVKEMRGVTLRGKKLQVDFASRECQDTFFDHLEKQGASSERPAFDAAREAVPRERSFDSSTLATTNRYTRYETPSRPRTSSYSSRSGTGSQCTGSSAVPSPGTPGSVTPRGSGSRSRLTRYNEYYEAGVEYPERRFRSYDEFSQGSGASHEDVYEHEYILNRESPGHVESVESRTMQSVVVTTEVPPAGTTFIPPDIRHLQKERVHLLEQLDECPSSGDELMSPKKRLKLDMCDAGNAGADMEINHGDHKKVIEVRRLSDTGIKHHSRRPSIDGKHCGREVPVERTYMPHAVCKRRKTSGSESDRSRIHHHHDMSGSESLAGSRPGTPLCDERPENLPPSEPRRLPRERNANEGPLSLPLPRFAAQVLNSPRLNISVAGFKGSKESIVSSPPTAVTSPKVMNPVPPSPVHVPPPASPPPRPPSSSNSSDSDAAPPSPTLEERLRSLDEKYEKWSGSRALSAAGGDALAKLDASASDRFRFRRKLLDLDLKELQPSEIVKSVLAKRSVFDEDSKRLENVGEKYEPRDFTVFPRTFVSLQSSMAPSIPPVVPASPLLSPAATSTKSLPGVIAKPSSTALSPRSLTTNIPAAKGLQYPFPSHPPVVSPVTGGTATAPSPARVTGNVHSDNTRLKLCPSLPSDRTNSKVNLNRSGCAVAPPSSVVSGAAVASTVPKFKSLDKNGDSDKINSNIPINSCENVSVNVSSSVATVMCSPANNSSDAMTNHVGKTPPRDKSSSRKEDRPNDKVNKSDKVVSRRDSITSSPSCANSSKCDKKDRRDKKSDKDNDASGDYRTVKVKDNDSECDNKRGKESEYCDRKLEEEKLRVERAEKEKQELDRKEKEERERMEKERQELERQEKEKLENERLEKENLEKERQEKEKIEKEKLERIEKERIERERLERERKKEKEEKERRDREERERREKEEQIEKDRVEKEKQRERREKEEREKREREDLEKERQEKELYEKQMKEKQEHRKREKEIDKHERRHKEDNHESKEKKKEKEEFDKQKQRENHSDNTLEIKNRHRENHIDVVKVNDRHSHDRKEIKDQEFKLKDSHDNMRNNHELQRKDSHDKSKDHHENSRTNIDRRDEKHSHCNEGRKEDNSKNRHHIDREDSKDRRKENAKEIRESNSHEKVRHFSTDSRDTNKDRHSSTDSRHTSTDSEKNRQYNDHTLNSTLNRIDVNKRKDKINSSPASVGCKRRISSQDSSESPDDSKRIKVSGDHKKILDRRDSKDSRDSNNSRSSDKIKQNKHNKSNFTRMLEDKIREEKRNKEMSDEKRREKERERDRDDRYKLKQAQKIEKQKIKSKSRDSRDSKDSPGTPKSNKELILDKDFLARIDIRGNEEEEKQKQLRKDNKEKRKQENHDLEERRSSDDTKRVDDRKKDKNVSLEKKNRDETIIKNLEEKSKSLQRKECHRVRKSMNSSDTSDSDEPKKHSIFDIVDDEPAYISMYDKVKARSCKNMQKQEEEKRQEKLKAKFTQLKQSRAKREEKKRSTSWDEDSDSDHMDSGNREPDHITNKQNRRGNKMLITSSSEDELQSMSKSRKKTDMYTDSDSDLLRIEKLERLMDTSDEENVRNKSLSRKGSKSRITSDTSEDEHLRQRIEKIKKERYSDSEVDQGFADSDERTDIKHYKKVKEEKLNHYDDEKYIKKEKKCSKTSMSDDDNTRKMLTDSVKAEIYNEKDLEVQVENNKCVDRLSMLCDISSEGEIVHNINNKKDLFGDDKSDIRKKHKKKQKRQKNSLLSEDIERMLDEVENDSGNRGEEPLEKIKVSEKKKHGSKKDRKREKVKDEDRMKDKSKKLKKLNKDLCSKGDMHNIVKRDGKLEDIFGSFSDDSETGNKDSLLNNIGNKENSFFVHLSDKLLTPHVYASDSDGVHHVDSEKEKLKEESRKRKEKKRKEKERRLREENENSVDFADLGKVLEDNLKDEPSSEDTNKNTNLKIKTEIKEEPEIEDNHHISDIFRFSDGDEHLEIEKKELEKKEIKEKRKKRKKSKEEKLNRHHHHHEKNQEKIEKIKPPDLIKKEIPIIIENIKEESDCKSIQQSPSLPNLLDIPSPPQEKSTPNNDYSLSPLSREHLINPIVKTPTSSKTEKKREKFIPGFGSEIDEKIHENAVKSISDFGSPTLTERIEQEEIKSDEAPKLEKSEGVEDKPRVIISQEETEDAVAALLGESFGGGDFVDCYNETQPSPSNPESNVETTTEEVTLVEDEEMRQAVQSLNTADMEAKPDTPQSENDLQIDTDTDEGEETVVPYEQSPRTPEMVDLSRPPKTPDFPTNYYRPEDVSKIKTPILIKSSTELSQVKSSVHKDNKQPDSVKELKRNIEIKTDNSVIPSLTRKVDQNPTVSAEQPRTVISQSWSIPIQKPSDKLVISEPVVDEIPVLEKCKSEQLITQRSDDSKSVHVPVSQKPMLPACTQPVTTLSTTILPSQPKSYLVPPIIKISEHSAHPSIISPKLEQSLSPMKTYNNLDISKISSTVPPALTTVMTKQRAMPQIPSSKPVRVQHAVISHMTTPSSKSLNSSNITPNSGGLSTTTITSATVQQNRLPIQSIMASKPMQPTTMILPQSKIAVSTIQKLVSSPEVTKHHDPPRMIYHNTGNITLPSYSYQHSLTHPQIISPPIQVPIRTSTPAGLLSPVRHVLPPTSYGLPPTTRSISPLVKESPKSVIEKTLPIVSELQKQIPTSLPAHIYSQSSFPQPPTSLHFANNDMKSSTHVIQEVSTPKLVPLLGQPPEVRVTQHSIIQQAPSQKTMYSPVSQSHQTQPSMVMLSKSITVPQSCLPAISHAVMSPSMILQPTVSHSIVSQPLTTHTMMSQSLVSQPHIIVSQPMIPKSIVSQPIMSHSVLNPPIISHTSTSQPVISHSISSTLSIATDVITAKPAVEHRTPVCLPQDIINEIPKVIKETFTRSTPSPVIVATIKENNSPTTVQEPVTIKKEEPVAEDTSAQNTNFSENIAYVKNEIKTEKENIPSVNEEATVDIKPKVDVCDVDDKPLDLNKQHETIDTVSVIKEIDHYEKEKQEDTESVISEPKENLNSDLCIKDDPLDSKEDSDYWSAKEVNIESVIKKVDALCSADELSENSDAGKEEWYDNENKLPKTEPKHEESMEKEQDKSEDCDTSDVTKTDAESENFDESLENNTEEKELSVRNSRRGGRMRGRKNNKSDRLGVTTRRGKTTTTASRRGGRGGRTRNDKKIKQSESDVYEFHDDSDESKDRPRLILTIKSPAGTGHATNTASAIIKESIQKPTELPREEFVSPAANTRKSRRIQERDGSRNTVDDVIEDVVRNAAVVTRSVSAAAQGLPSPRRSTRQNVMKQPPVVEPRKSPRATKRKDRRVSENTDDSSEEKSVKKEEIKPEIEQIKEEPLPKETIKMPPKQQEKEKAKVENQPMGLKANLIRRLKSEEPMTLIDPVTGLLTQMRECEEGKYIPVATSASSVITGTIIGSAAENKPEIVESCRPPISTVPTSHTATEQIPTTVIAKSQPTVPLQQKPQSLKAHVLSSQAAKVVVSQTQIPKTATVQSIPQPQPSSNFITKSNIPVNQNLNVNVSVAAVDPTNLSPRQATPKPVHVLSQTIKTVTPSPMSPNQIGPINNPKQHFLQAVNKQIPQKPSTPLNPKAHLLNAVQNQNIVTGTPPVVNATLTHMKTHLPQSSSLPNPVKQQVVGNVAPIVKPHNLHVPQQILTGAVASPPLKHHIAQQPIVAGASSGRMGIPSSSPMPGISAKGALDAQKVEVSMSGCVMISHPTVSPQAQTRGQVLQAGMPVPAYEASLHGVGDHPLFSRQSPPPAHQQTSPAPQGEQMAHFPPGAMPLRSPHDLPPHHFMHTHQVYQQYLRAQQEARIPYHLPRSPMVGGLEKTKDGQEGEEAPVTSPPLELRRPGSVGLTARPTAVPHSLQSPHDRTTDSPQVAQVYMHQARMPHYHTPGRYYETPAEPPPAHRPVTSHTALAGPGSSLGAAGNLTGAMARHTGAEAPTSQRGLQVATPPHASQVPPQADSLLMLLKQYRIMWQGLLALKNDQAAVQMHFVFGNPHVARNSLPCNSDGSTPPLRIAQRMRLEKTQVEGVARKMQMENEHCVLLALPCGRDHMDVLQQSTNLSNGFITYLQQKEAAGIVNIAAPGSQQAAYVVHIFPSCDFVKENLARIAPNLLHRVADIAHLLIVIATV